MRAGTWLWAFLVSVGCSGGGSNSVPISQIPPDKKLVELSSGENQGVCDWATGVAKEKLAGASCNGNPITFNGCMTPGPMCTATVAEYQGCFPNLMDRFASDPCKIISLAFSQSDLAAFIEATTGCAGQGPCGTVMH